MTSISVKVALPKGIDHIWAAACQFGEAGFTTRDLLGLTNGVKYQTLDAWVRRMVARDLFAIAGESPRRDGACRINRYVVKRPSKRPPIAAANRGGEAQLHLWTAMRSLPHFTLSELVTAASTDEIAIKRKTAGEYVRRLAQVGLLIELRPSRSLEFNSGVWRLRKSADTGPKAPQLLRADFVFDTNRNVVIGWGEASL